MRRIMLVVVVAALMVAMMVVMAMPALAAPPGGFFTSVCPSFQTGHGTFTQRLPEPARHGAETSNTQVNERTGSDCRILGS